MTLSKKDKAMKAAAAKKLQAGFAAQQKAIAKDIKVVEKLKFTEKELKQKNAQIEKDAELIMSLTQIKSAAVKTKSWLQPKRNKSDSAIATSFLSDLHLDEVVDPAQICGANAYNRKIATLRIKKFFENTIKLSRDYFSGINMDTIILPLGGDLVSGNIHEELALTNEAPMMDTVMFWTDQIASGIELLGNHFDKIYIPVVTGNHGRSNHGKTFIKGRVQSNFDYLIGKILERQFVKQKEIVFDVSESPDARWTAYNHRVMMTHGDSIKGSNPNVMAINANKKLARDVSYGKPWDLMIIGHFHTFKDYGNVLINGSTKGMDEFSYSFSFKPEPPQQAFWLTDPKHGKTIVCPVHCVEDGGIPGEYK